MKIFILITELFWCPPVLPHPRSSPGCQVVGGGVHYWTWKAKKEPTDLISGQWEVLSKAVWDYNSVLGIQHLSRKSPAVINITRMVCVTLM